MKKKLTLVIALAAVILTIAIAGGTLAWFTADDAAKNTFTVGRIEITQYEQEHDANGDLQSFTQDQDLLPIVNVSSPADDGNYVEKIVTVENTGRNNAYVRTFIAYPKALKDVLHLDTVGAGTTAWAQDSIQWDDQTVDGVVYEIISFTYTDILEKNDVTEAVLNGVYLDAALDIKVNPANNLRQFCTFDANGVATYYDFDVTEQIQVLVATQGGQSNSFEAYGAVNAMNQMFGQAPDMTEVQ